MNTSPSHPLFSAPITASALHWELAVPCRQVFPSRRHTSSSVPHRLDRAAHTDAVKTGGYWPVNEQITRSIHRDACQKKGKCQSLRGWSVANSNANVNPLRSFHDRIIPWQVRHQFRCYMSRPELPVWAHLGNNIPRTKICSRVAVRKTSRY